MPILWDLLRAWIEILWAIAKGEENRKKQYERVKDSHIIVSKWISAENNGLTNIEASSSNNKFCLHVNSSREHSEIIEEYGNPRCLYANDKFHIFTNWNSPKHCETYSGKRGWFTQYIFCEWHTNWEWKPLIIPYPAYFCYVSDTKYKKIFWEDININEYISKRLAEKKEEKEKLREKKIREEELKKWHNEYFK